MNKLLRKGKYLVLSKIGILGSFMFSGANFFVAYLIQGSSGAYDFGNYIFITVVIQFGISLSNALFASPMVVWIHSPHLHRLEVIASFFRANIYAIFLGSITVFLIFDLMGLSKLLAGMAALQSAMLWMRWFFRAVELAEQKYLQASIGDIVYSVVLLCGAIFFFSFFEVTIYSALLCGLLGASASTISLICNHEYQILTLFKTKASIFIRAFREHGIWALIGVTTTEITSNAHSYIIALYLGPSAFALVALISLYLRPMPILMQTLTQYERARLASLFATRRNSEALIVVRKISIFLSGALIVNSAGIIILASQFPSVFSGSNYSVNQIILPLLLLSMSQLLRGLRTGPSAALQAVGKFRKLSFVTMISAPVVAVLCLVPFVMEVHFVNFTLLSILIGELITCILINRLYRNEIRG